MTAAQADSGRPRPVERFKPTSGALLGWTGLVCAAVAIVYCAFAVHTVTGLRVALGAAVAAVVIWLTQLRPRATAYPHHLVLQNVVRDTAIPLGAIEEVSVRQSLQVYAQDRRHVCIGIGEPLREELKRRRRHQQSLLGSSRWGEFAARAERAAPDQTAMSYPTFVVTRIEELVDEEKRSLAGRDPGRVNRAWAWPELAVLAGTGIAFVASFLL
jgi:hypothetical protein